jgi:hypothetical protein
VRRALLLAQTLSLSEVIFEAAPTCLQTASPYCSWTRLKDFTGGYSQNASGIDKAQQIVDIKTTDVGFESDGTAVGLVDHFVWGFQAA